MRLSILAAAAVVACGAASVHAALVHQWSFNSSSGNTTPDSIDPSTPATLVNAATVSGNQAQLSNYGTRSYANNVNYVALPVSALPTTSPTVTLEEWFTATNAGNSWSRAFDFNADTLNSDTSMNTSPGPNTDPYAFAALDAGSNNSSKSAISSGGYNNEAAVNVPVIPNTSNSLVDGSQHMIAVVFNDPSNTLSYYIDGTLAGTATTDSAHTWEAVSPHFTNAWLGRSAFPNDGGLNGSIDEFRIFNDALTASQIAADNTAGPNVVASEPVPEPSTLLLAGVIVAGLPLLKRRRLARV